MTAYLITALGKSSPVYAQQAEWDGSLSGSRRWTSADSGEETQQDSITLNLNERGFIWRPWFATNRLQLYLQESWTEFTGAESTTDQSTNSKLIAGSGFLTLGPQSRFASEAFVDIYDLRVETNTVGIPLQDVNTLRRERTGLTQHYRTIEGQSNYAVQGVRTRTFTRDDGTEITDEYWAFGANRFENQQLNYRVSQRDTERDEPDTSSTEGETSLTVHHDYRPDDIFSAESAFDGTRSDERLENVDTHNEITSLASFLTWRPADGDWTARVTLSRQSYRQTTDLDVPPQALMEPLDSPQPEPDPYGLELGTLQSSEQHISSALSSFTYRITDSLQFTGDAGVTQTESDQVPDSEQRFESATLAFSPAPIPLVGSLNYRWNTQGTVGNTDDSNTGSVQNYSAGVGHGLEYIASVSDTMTVTLSLGQDGTRFGDSEGANLLEVRHVTSAAAIWAGSSSLTRTQLNYTHSRTTGVDPVAESDGGGDLSDPSNREQDGEVDLTVQSLYADASESHRATRFSTLDGTLSAGRTRVDDKGRRSSFTFVHAGGGYTYHHVFNIDQLLFRTRLEYELHETDTEIQVSVVDDQSTPQDERFVSEQELLSWDSRLDYIIGLLTLSLRRTVIAINGDYLRITVISATRRF